MVSSISDNLYASMGIGSFSQGSSAVVDKTDTEIFEDVFDSVLESTDESEKTSGSGGASSNEDEDYDEMDLNKDGVVSASERVMYEMMQGGVDNQSKTSSITDMFEMNAGSISNVISAYCAA